MFCAHIQRLNVKTVQTFVVLQARKHFHVKAAKYILGPEIWSFHFSSYEYLCLLICHAIFLLSELSQWFASKRQHLFTKTKVYQT